VARTVPEQVYWSNAYFRAKIVCFGVKTREGGERERGGRAQESGEGASSPASHNFAGFPLQNNLGSEFRE